MIESLDFVEVASIVALVGTIFSGAWVLARLLVSRRVERTQLVIDLHAEFFSTAMTNARRLGWYALEEAKKHRPITFSKLFRSADAAAGAFPAYDVMSFFYRIYILDQRNRIDRTLTRKLFSYQYAHWYDQTRELVEDSYRYDSDRPEVFEAFQDKSMNWLLRGAKIGRFQPESEKKAGV